jgi:ATP-dependent helicase/nuclease subunit A
MAVTFISAGAGSGKTYRLTQLLLERLASGEVAPAGVIATTFTRKAAAELRERVRGALLKKGAFSLATAIGQARIGTVNSVCGAFLERFAFEAGLPPRLRVLEVAQAEAVVREAIDAVCDLPTMQEIGALADDFGLEDWQGTLKQLVDAARANALAPQALVDCATRNARDLLAHFPPATDDDLDRLLERAIKAALPAFAQKASAIGKTQKFVANLEEVLHGLQGSRLAWADWVRLSKNAPEAKLRELGQSVTEVAARFAAHPRLHQQLRRFLELLFTLAASVLDVYAEKKRALGVIDFTDQEQLFLALLDKPSVVEALREELTLLLVDEFQDTSPIQLALFVRLAGIARETVWVGDVKQAIFGFRGSDTELMAAVLAELPAWGGVKEVLGRSYRSRPALVSLVNGVFGEAFAPGLAYRDVALVAHRPETVDDCAFAHWTLEGGSVAVQAAALAEGVAQFVASGYRVVDPQTGDPRAVHAGDIAILCSTNDRVQGVAAALRARGVPWATQQSGLLATPEAVLAIACLRRLHDAGDTLASAQIVSIADGVPAEDWLSERLRYLQAGGDTRRWREEDPGAHPLLVTIAALRVQLPLLSPCAALERVLAHCDLSGRVLRWRRDPLVAQVRLANLEALVGMARAYEDGCISSQAPATVAGLLLWLDEQAGAATDMLAEPTVAAVKVMTHHAAKGLEWPVVILMDLDKDLRDALWSVGAHTDGAMSAAVPLGARWVRYWPWAFARQKKFALADEIAASAAGTAAREAAVSEARRLLYVSMTRARDCLVLARPGKGATGEWLGCVDAPWLLPAAEATSITLPDGSLVAVTLQTLEAQDTQGAREPEAALRWFPAPQGRSVRLPHARIASAEQATAHAVAVEPLGQRIDISAGVDMAALGSAIHACIALAFCGGERVLDNDSVGALLTGFEVAGQVDAASVVDQVAALGEWIGARWPGARCMAEVPVEAVLDGGQVIRGRIDLLVDTGDGWVLIDHKSNPAPRARWGTVAAEHGGQLALYARALEVATGRPVKEAWVALVVAGGVVRLDTCVPEGAVS